MLTRELSFKEVNILNKLFRSFSEFKTLIQERSITVIKYDIDLKAIEYDKHSEKVFNYEFIHQQLKSIEFKLKCNNE